MADSPTRSPLLEALDDRVLVADGAMGTMLQAVDLSLDDFAGLEGCNEILNVTRPDVVREVHRRYLAAGSDAIETNTFGANLANLAEYDIADRIFELAHAGARLARDAADEFAEHGQPRFVLGSVGPGTKLPTLGHAPFAVLRDAYVEQARGLLVGGADAVLVETCQDLLQAKAAIIGAKRAMAAEGITVPVIVHVTVELTGTMLVGSDISTAMTSLVPLGVDLIGLNCATGPAQMSEHLRTLAAGAGIGVSVMPNAGLPELGPNGAVYPLGPDDLAEALVRFVTEFRVRMVGGCCGTTEAHIAAITGAVRGLSPATSTGTMEPAVSSMYQAVPFAQDASVLMIGERTNANGSKAFRDAMLEGRFDDCVEIAKGQTRDGAHMLDVCVDYVGRDGVADMAEVASRLATASTLPVMLDSTEVRVLESGLERLGGRCAVNSVNYEDGDGPESRFCKVMALVAEYGATVVALTIDEEGQARTAEHKVAIAERLIDQITGDYGLRESDIIVDTLTFTIATGQEESRKDAMETIEAIRQLKAKHPAVQTTLGLSNVSFGLNPAARQVLNSVFLDECVKAGLDTAIVHASKILPISRIPEEQLAVALDLVYDRRAEDYDPLQRFMQLFEGVTAKSSKQDRAAELAALPLYDRLQRRIVDGERNGLEADLDAAMLEKPPLEIINDTLLSGMKTVGELFGSGQMQLPFVLASAEVMKTAVAYLEPHMDRSGDAGKGRIVLATVKGDVHDIGKNLVDIILSNNGYTVVNLGIKQPITAILDAAEEHRADVIGMSGLLVKSTVIMKENLEEMNSRGVANRWPVLLGGAALTRAYVEDDLSAVYQGDVHYARDAFEGLRLMDTILSASADAMPDPAVEAKKAERRARRERSKRIAAARAASVEPDEIPARSDVPTDLPIPAPPFWGDRIVTGISVSDYAAMLDERALFLGQWGLRGSRGDGGPTYEELVETEGRPRLRYWLDRLATDGILRHAGVAYGYFPAVADGNDIVVLAGNSPDALERTRFTFPRQHRDRHLCLADFLRPRDIAISEGAVDVIGFHLCTMGQPIADYANVLFADNAYRDYLEIHGLGVQLTEALAEHWHRRVRAELTYADGTTVAAKDADNVTGLIKQEYTGARFSLGYGACPDLDDRAKIVELLQPDRIGVKLSDESQLHPEQSTDAIIIHHPHATYFNT